MILHEINCYFLLKCLNINTFVPVYRQEDRNTGDRDGNPATGGMVPSSEASDESQKPTFSCPTKPPPLPQRPLKGFKAPTRAPLSTCNSVGQTHSSTTQGQGMSDLHINFINHLNYTYSYSR